MKLLKWKWQLEYLYCCVSNKKLVFESKDFKIFTIEVMFHVTDFSFTYLHWLVLRFVSRWNYTCKHCIFIPLHWFIAQAFACNVGFDVHPLRPCSKPWNYKDVWNNEAFKWSFSHMIGTHGEICETPGAWQVSRWGTRLNELHVLIHLLDSSPGPSLDLYLRLSWLF